jgi:succinyl-diaminopimelate desuccinylase
VAAGDSADGGRTAGAGASADGGQAAGAGALASGGYAAGAAASTGGGHAALIDAMRDEMVKNLRELIACKSVAGPREEGAPFGAGVQAAFARMLALAETDGFDTKNADNYGGHIEFGGAPTDEDGEITGSPAETLGILGHLDVVPEGRDWSCDPFEGKLENGRVYGRGAMDDKGPTLACYYAMKALKNSGFMPRKRVRLILGLDEETDWAGMEHYLSKIPPPDFGFVPDAEFPAIHGEMGILVFELAKKLSRSGGAKGLELRKLNGGNAANMVPDQARVLLRGDSYEKIKEQASAYREETGFQLSARNMGKNLEITARGVSAHGATPEKGLNAISVLMAFLGQAGAGGEGFLEFLDFYNRCVGFELHGESMGCGFSDVVSGKLIFNAGVISGDS